MATWVLRQCPNHIDRTAQSLYLFAHFLVGVVAALRLVFSFQTLLGDSLVLKRILEVMVHFYSVDTEGLRVD